MTRVGERVERGRHEVAAVVGEQAGEVDRPEGRRRFEPIALSLHRARRAEVRRVVHERGRRGAERQRAGQRLFPRCRRQDELARCAGKRPASARSDRMRSGVTPPWNSTRCARLNGYATTPAALRSVCRKRIVSSISDRLAADACRARSESRRSGTAPVRRRRPSSSGSPD